MLRGLTWIFAVLVMVFIIGIPSLYYRYSYENYRRLRVVTEGRFLRSGQMTATGFRDACRRYNIRMVINLQEEFKDPFIPEVPFAKPSISESEVLQQLDPPVRYISLDGGVLDDPNGLPADRPPVLDDFFEILDQAQDRYWSQGKDYPILIHCKAGLHRTGLLTAVYRMEYEQHSPARVVEELRANGFGTFAATDGNVYLQKFIVDYRPGLRRESKTPTNKIGE